MSATTHKLAWQRICVAHVIFYGAPVSDFHEDAVKGLMIDLVAEDGYCIGEFLASVFAFLGGAFLVREAAGSTAMEECKAHFLASSDNAVVTGEVKHVIMFIRRMIEIAKLEDLADFQEQRVLRTIPVNFESGPFNYTTEAGRAAICSRLSDAVQGAVISSYDGAPTNSEGQRPAT